MKTINTLDLGDAGNAPDDTVTIRRDGNALKFKSPAAGEVTLEALSLGSAHNIPDHPDTSATGAELNTLTDGSNADALHDHTAAGITLDHSDLGNVTSDQHHAETHTIVSHDTTATGANLTTLTDNSMASALHRHDGLSANDGTPDAVLSLDATGNVTFNEAGADLDWRMESAANTHALFMQGSDGRIGLGQDTPLALLHIGNDAIDADFLAGITGLIIAEGNAARIHLQGQLSAALDLVDAGAGGDVKLAQLYTDDGVMGLRTITDAGAIGAGAFSVAMATGNVTFPNDVTVEGEIFGDILPIPFGRVASVPNLNSAVEFIDFVGVQCSATKGVFVATNQSIAGFFVNYDVTAKTGGALLTVGVAVNGVSVFEVVVDPEVGAGKLGGDSQARGIDTVSFGDIVSMFIEEKGGSNISVENIQCSIAFVQD